MSDSLCAAIFTRRIKAVHEDRPMSNLGIFRLLFLAAMLLCVWVVAIRGR